MINEQNLSNMDIEEELTDLENAKDIIEEDYDEDKEEDEIIEIDFKNKKVNLNMLKKRAKKAPDITSEMWNLCNR